MGKCRFDERGMTMLLVITEDEKVLCPRAGEEVKPEDICCPPTKEKDYDGYYDCSYFAGFEINNAQMCCHWPESLAAEWKANNNGCMC